MPTSTSAVTPGAPCGDRLRTPRTSAKVIDRLLASDEPSIRWKVRVKVLGEKPSRATTAGAAPSKAAPFSRRTDGSVIRPVWTKLHYPSYWHYDLLSGLKALAEIGAVTDPRCAEALDPLESKRLPDGGWAVEARYHRGAGKTPASSDDFVNWGGVGKRGNPWITADALSVLAAARRL